MMYKFLQLDDGTEIVHSDIITTDGNEKVKVYVEKPIYGGFKSAVCYVPSYEWRDVDGFSAEEIDRYTEVLESTAHLIIRFARQGGFGNAANL